MNTVHIEGHLEGFDICKELSDNYDHDGRFDFEEESDDVIPNCFVRMYFSQEKITLEDAVKWNVKKMLGDFEMTGQETGYSEYTITGFDVYSAKLGGHDLNKIIQEAGRSFKYVHILIDQLEDTL